MPKISLKRRRFEVTQCHYRSSQDKTLNVHLNVEGIPQRYEYDGKVKQRETVKKINKEYNNDRHF